MYSQEEIKRAIEIDLVNYCNKNGIDIKSDNERYYRLIDHDSCVIDRRKNIFYWNSRDVGGNVIKFVQEIENVNFKEAMEHLYGNGENSVKYQANKKVEYIAEPYEYNPANEVPWFDKAKNYLVKKRKIDSDIIDDIHERGLIKQDKHNNILFLWKDYENIMGCSEQGTYQTDKFKRGTWKSIQKNSTANYGFNIKYGKPKNLKFFESSIDLLSYATLNKDKLVDMHLISMEGLKHNTVFNYILKAKEQLGDSPDSIALCVDNDKAGHAFIEKLENLQIKKNDSSVYDFTNELPINKGLKDWNDQLKMEIAKKYSLQCRNKEI